jgi:hypothetical protein
MSSNHVTAVTAMCDGELVDAKPEPIEVTVDRNRLEAGHAQARADEALRTFERLTLDHGYAPTQPGRDVPDVVRRLKWLLDECVIRPQ